MVGFRRDASDRLEVVAPLGRRSDAFEDEDIPCDPPRFSVSVAGADATSSVTRVLANIIPLAAAELPGETEVHHVARVVAIGKGHALTPVRFVDLARTTSEGGDANTLPQQATSAIPCPT